MEDTVDLIVDSFFSLRERTAASQPSANISMDASLLLGNGPGYLILIQTLQHHWSLPCDKRN